ncbi:insulin [Gadus morhua]|uniref:insulin n=1 Tax=Gadus morhua TaxID=8049 RepID=UPI0011B70801|nr:insulin-like [Gadus morhua]XP_030218386.1 insulin-like [Gadus morhua]XP_030218387.1 insulin-like [Gadus morhua]
MGMTKHDNHQLLGYKVKGFPQFILTANSSQQLKQRSISSTFSSHLPVTSPPTLSMSRLLHAGSIMMVLLALSWSRLEAMGRPQYFCGDHLVETLNQVCGDRGYNLTRAVDSNAGSQSSTAGGTRGDQLATNAEVQCCHGNGCNIYDLQNYCH